VNRRTFISAILGLISYLNNLFGFVKPLPPLGERPLSNATLTWLEKVGNHHVAAIRRQDTIQRFIQNCEVRQLEARRDLAILRGEEWNVPIPDLPWPDLGLFNGERRNYWGSDHTSDVKDS
jgi:hypothetical protein